MQVPSHAITGVGGHFELARPVSASVLDAMGYFYLFFIYLFFYFFFLALWFFYDVARPVSVLPLLLMLVGIVSVCLCVGGVMT